jgi:pimeloyl-ACP methyl ester carboxylesterase
MTDRRRSLISFHARDGFLVHSLLVADQFESEEDLYETPVVIQVHGVLGNFLARGTPRLLPPALLERGYSSFVINTRMAFLGQIMGEGIFDDTIYDIEASIDYLTREGYRNIFILGYSLGANIVAYYASERFDPTVKGLVLEGCAYSLPDSQKKRLNKWNSIPSYEAVYKRAKKILKPDPYHTNNDQIFVIYRAWAPSFNPLDAELFTYRTWWFMRGPEAYNAKTCDLIENIKVPVLFIQGSNDDIVEEWESRELARKVYESGNKDVTLRYISNAKHDCMENPEETIETIVEWIAKIENKPLSISNAKS